MNEESPPYILLVEDSLTQAEELKYTLEQNGFATRHARNGVEALTILRERKPLLVISDINMPEMDGYELCRRIRADAALADLPVILLTSLSQPEDVVHGLECGADNFVTKPPGEDYLISRIRYIMANRHLRSLESARISLEVVVGGRKHNITADRLQILHLLLSTYETAVQRNKQLLQTQEELRRLNESLETKVRERTADLTKEVAERKRLHEELQESEVNYRRLFASNPMPMWVFDLETLRFLAVNDAAVIHYGYSREEFLALTILDIRPEQEQSALRHDLRHPPANFVKGEWVHRKRNGDVIQVEITGHDLAFEGRQARLILAKDVTARKRAEAALRESEERVRLITETITEVFWMVNAEFTKVLYLSPAYEKVLGRARDKLLSDPLSLIEQIRAEDRPVYRQCLRSLKEGKPFAAEYRIIRPDGSVRWLWDRGFPVYCENGQVRSYVGSTLDITDRKEAEEFRKSSEERLAAVIRSSPVGIGYNTSEGRILEANDQLCEFFGYSRDELVGHTWVELGLWANEQERAVVLSILATKGLVRNHEIRCRRKSGELRSGLLSLETVRITDSPIHLISIVDLTERKALEAELHRFQRTESMGRLASGIAHDMNNILAPIMMSAPLLRMGLPAADAESILSTIEASAQRGAALVRQLLIFGRGVEGERRPVRPSSVVEEVTKIAEQTFPRNIIITATVPENEWLVHGDTTQLYQVLLNLCVNARDAMPQGGRLNITSENIEIDEYYCSAHPDAKPGRHVVIRVSDTGMGMPAEIVEKIFEPFFTTKPVGQGTGLGLSTALGIVKSHRGFVRLQSEPGRGTMFEVYLPATIQEEPVARRETTTQSVQGRGELILVVDDEENIRAVLRDLFVRNNYKVLTAQDGVEATAIFAANPDVQLIFTDLDMPLMDGINLSRVLRRLNPVVRIVISTGAVTDNRIEELNALGVSAVLRKPFTGEQLLRVVHSSVTSDGPSGPVA